MTRPEIIVYRSDMHNCFYVSLDNGKTLIDPDDPVSWWEGKLNLWSPHEIKDLREVWRSGHE